MVILEHISYRLDRYFFSEFEGGRRTNREEEYRQVFMDSVLNHRQYQNNDSNSGLLRFRTAPNSMLANFTNGIYKGSDSFENFSNSRPSSHEIQGLTSGFNPSEDNSNSILQSFPDLEEGKPLANGYSSQLPPHYPRQSSATQLAAMDGPYKVVGSMAMDHQRAGKLGSNLMRQRSSPAGLFSHFPVQNGMMSQISEIESEFIRTNGHDDGKLGDDKMGTQFHSSGHSLSSWNDSTHFTENFTGLKRDLDNDGKLFAGGIQNGEIGNHTHILSHHLTLPRTSAEMADVEKLLQFQDSVPCKIRAKRGCATHPRSIAERMRRTRISERMRKLQELVPNMDKQTNTADMLDFAVEYIKELQKQYKMLSENRAKCNCSSIQKPIPNQTV